MRTLKFLIPAMTLLVIACSTSQKNPAPTVNADSLPLYHNPTVEAQRLLDSAVAINNSPTVDSAGMRRAYEMVLQALKLDSGFGAARMLKPAFERNLGLLSEEESFRQYDQEQVRVYFFVASVGKVYDDKGDTATANAYYKSVITRVNQMLDTMPEFGQARSQAETMRIIAWVCLGKNDDANKCITDAIGHCDDLPLCKILPSLGHATKDQLYAASVTGVWNSTR